MAEKFNISFKKAPKSEVSFGRSQPTTIRVNRLECGTIHGPSWDSGGSDWKVQVAVIPPGYDTFKYITFKIGFDTEPEARVWVKENLKRISEKYNVYYFDD